MNSIEVYNKKNDNNLSLSGRITKIWGNIPLFIKFFLLTTFSFYILNLFLKNISQYFANIPYYTISYFQIWRLITTVFISTNLFKLFLGLFCWLKYASSLESSIGTIKYMSIFFINTFFIQIIFCILKYALMHIFKKDNNYLKSKISTKGVNNFSLLGTILCELTLLCLSNPESPNKLFFIPITIKAKYYPFILIGIFIIVDALKIDLEIISGILFAYIYFYFFKNILKISDNFAQKIEDTICCKNILELNSFISVSNINNGNPLSITNISVNQIRIENNNKDNDMEELNINKGATIKGNLDLKDDYSKI